MNAKEDLIKHALQALIRIAHLYARIEAMPIPVDCDNTISTGWAHTIKAIGDEEKISITRVAEHFGVSKSAASQMVAKLEKIGYLDKKPAAHSNKEFEISLTESGWRVFHAHEQFHFKDFTQLVKSLSAFPIAQIATLSVLMETLGRVMEKRISKHSGR